MSARIYRFPNRRDAVAREAFARHGICVPATIDAGRLVENIERMLAEPDATFESTASRAKVPVAAVVAAEVLRYERRDRPKPGRKPRKPARRPA